MSEEIKPKSYEELQQIRLNEEKERIDRMDKVRHETVQRLETDPEIQKYFEQFNKNSIESFIQTYGHSKAGYMEYGAQFAKYNEDANMAYYEAAYKCLEQIQLKKLFDLKLQWGANNITLPDIESIWDFYPHSMDVFNCPFLPPITEEEFELFLEFANSEHFEEEPETDWLDYTNSYFMDEDEKADLPEWFLFHNNHSDARQYLSLPDIRGKQEDFYRNFWIKENQQETEKKYESGEYKRPGPMDQKPYIHAYQFETLNDFVKRFENEDARKKFMGYQEFQGATTKNSDGNDDYLNERAEELIGSLIKLHPALPIEANADWRVALIDTWDKYETSQTIAALQIAYQDYLFHVENKIMFEVSDRKKNNVSHATNMKQGILRGRELNGEPRDFNF